MAENPRVLNFVMIASIVREIFEFKYFPIRSDHALIGS